MGFGTGDPYSLMRELLRITGGSAVIDGGLATELEAHGANLNDPLWSARCLIDSPHLIRKVHLDYLEAGANIIISASYQATIQGFESRGFSTHESEALLRRSVEIACEAREMFLKGYSKGSCDVNENKLTSMQQPILVAASIGSYGAYLADGSEYSGDYGEAITKESLKDFHRRRFQVLAESGADLIAFETIPNKIEAQAYVELLEESNINIPAWFSFNSKDGVCTVNGDSIIECASIADSCNKVVAVGINCTPPRFIHGLILLIRKVTEKPILIYPNSGETYDASKKEWVPSSGVSDEGFISYIKKWQEVGASLIGGCCRTTPDTIRAISRTLFGEHGLRTSTTACKFQPGSLAPDAMSLFGVVRYRGEGHVVAFSVLSSWQTVVGDIYARWGLRADARIRYVLPDEHKTSVWVSTDSEFQMMCNVHTAFGKNIVEMVVVVEDSTIGRASASSQTEYVSVHR